MEDEESDQQTAPPLSMLSGVEMIATNTREWKKAAASRSKCRKKENMPMPRGLCKRKLAMPLNGSRWRRVGMCVHENEKQAGLSVRGRPSLASGLVVVRYAILKALLRA